MIKMEQTLEARCVHVRHKKKSTRKTITKCKFYVQKYGIK